MTENIDITGLNPAAVLAALYNNSRVQGMGFLQAKPGEMTIEDAEDLLGLTNGLAVTDGFTMGREEGGVYFDYLHGKVMKIKIPTTGEGEIDPWGYDRDNGPGAAARAIDSARVAASA